MATVHANVTLVKTGESPRSTVLAGSTSMATDKMASDGATSDSKVNSVGSTSRSIAEGDSLPGEASSNGSKNGKGNRTGMAESPAENGLGQSSFSAQVPPTVSGYYPGYPAAAPPSPSVPGSVISGLPYDNAAGAFVQQPSAFSAAHTSPFGVPNGDSTPLSPPRSSSMASVPPASPLFPRVSTPGGIPAHQITPQSPGFPYSMSLTSTGPYPSYAATARMASQASSSSDDGNWDRNIQNLNSYTSSPGMVYGMLGRGALGGRTYSVDSDSMLPPAAIDPNDQANPAYSPYSTGHPGSPGGNMFTHQHQWSYPGPLPDMYSTPGSPLQPRPTMHQQPMHMYPGPMIGMRGMGAPYGHYSYPPSSPGPPIQTTGSNKGPDGANLFIFHIPNHFTNVDMYNLFYPFGNLLSVRIMVEKDTGRSRGFGFVSYDNAGSAALAIKELNGYAIGNKRLKVQHKQIRQRDMHERDGVQGMEQYGEGSPDNGYSHSLPPSGPGGHTAVWYDRRDPGDEAEDTQANDAATAPTAACGESSGESKSRESAEADSAEAESPLAGLGSLQSALPEVASTPAHE